MASAAPPSRLVRVLYSFDAEDAGELSVKAGDLCLLKGAFWGFVRREAHLPAPNIPTPQDLQITRVHRPWP